MSEECCGPDEAPTKAAPRRLELSRTRPAADSCCAPGSADADGHADAHGRARSAPEKLLTIGAVPTIVDDGDACCGGPDPAKQPAHGEHDEEHEVRPPIWRDPALLPSAIAGVFLLTAYLLEWNGLEIPALVASWIGLLAGAYTFVPGAIRRLLRRRLGVGLLMTIAAIGAVALGQVTEAAALAFLFSLAEALEDRAMDRAKEGLRALLSLLPETVRISRLSGDVVVPSSELRELDILVVGAGERVATDGVVVEGRSSVDTSAVTGESIPVEVGPGDVVPAGSVNGAATLRIEATADGRDNSLTQIVALVEQAHARKGERARLADRIAKPLVPGVLILSALVAAFGFVVGDPWTWLERALVVLVAASPCALAIAVPVTVISAIGAASKFGVVIKSGEAFEQFGTIRAVALDKTGTLTRNEPQVVEVRTVGGVSRDELLALAAAVETSSTHPLAAALVAAAPDATPAEEVVEEAGRGVVGRVGTTAVRVGNVRWLDTADLAADAEQMAGDGMTVVVVEAAGRLAGLVGIRDELRSEAPETVRMLQDAGIQTVMLTGDNERTARALAAEAGIADVRAEQLPKDKSDAVQTLAATTPTAMVGDGINDAPALASATVGIAMGLRGSAAAIESADIAFTGHDLRLIPGAFAHARRARVIMTVNIVLALGLIIVLMPLALFGVLGLAAVVLAHELAEVVIILNGVRAAQRPKALRALAAADAPTRERVAA